MSINVIVHYPENMEELKDKLSDVLSEILFKKLQPKELEQFMELLENDDPRIKL